MPFMLLALSCGVSGMATHLPLRLHVGNPLDLQSSQQRVSAARGRGPFAPPWQLQELHGLWHDGHALLFVICRVLLSSPVANGRDRAGALYPHGDPAPGSSLGQPRHPPLVRGHQPTDTDAALVICGRGCVGGVGGVGACVLSSCWPQQGGISETSRGRSIQSVGVKTIGRFITTFFIHAFSGMPPALAAPRECNKTPNEENNKTAFSSFDSEPCACF